MVMLMVLPDFVMEPCVIPLQTGTCVGEGVGEGGVGVTVGVAVAVGINVAVGESVGVGVSNKT